MSLLDRTRTLVFIGNFGVLCQFTKRDVKPQRRTCSQGRIQDLKKGGGGGGAQHTVFFLRTAAPPASKVAQVPNQLWAGRGGGGGGGGSDTFMCTDTFMFFFFFFFFLGFKRGGGTGRVCPPKSATACSGSLLAVGHWFGNARWAGCQFGLRTCKAAVTPSRKPVP